jgi:hypothetical protein
MTGDFFVDYLSVRQYHGEAAKEFVGTLSFGLDQTGQVERESAKGRPIEGSYSSKLFIKSHGGTVTVTGNPSRWNRADNLFGFSLDECMTIVNAELGRLGLPAFTQGQPIYTQGGVRSIEDADKLPEWTGARFSMLHLTRNMRTGSDFLAKLAIRSYSSRSGAYMRKHVYGEETVMFHNTRRTVKAYRKGPDMRKHCSESSWTDWAMSEGIVRQEVELKSRYLSDTRMAFWGNCTMARLYTLFEKETEILRRPDASLDPLALECAPRASRIVYAAWLKGENVRALCSRASFYRHRKALLPHGIDLAEVRHCGDVVPIVREVVLTPAVAPAGYWDREAA